jgi:DNA-binding beta-propeller fold protein YncE/mono/diheme cytochrome c family protein
VPAPAPRAPAPAKTPLERIVAHTGSGVALATLNGVVVALVADADERRIVTVAVGTGRMLGMTALDGTPAQILTLPNGRVAVTLRDKSRVLVLEGAGALDRPLTQVATIDVPAEPIGLATTPDDALLVVTSGWGQAITVVTLADLRVRATRELGREPRGVAVSHDGRRAFVAHAAGSGLSIVDLDDDTKKPKIWHLEAESWVPGWRGHPTGPFNRRPAQGYAVTISEAPEGRVFLPHVAVHTGSRGALIQPGEVVEVTGYGTPDVGPAEVFDVAVVDERTGTPLDFEPRPSGDPTQGNARIVENDVSCLLPRAATSRGMNVYVACLDADRVVELDAASIMPSSMPLRRWQVPRGPVALAIDPVGERLVVWSEIAHALTTFSLDVSAPARPIVAATFPRGREDAMIARGRDLFHSGEKRISGDRRACASCHPDGRDDGLVWDTPDGPRQTPMLAGRLDGTGPYGWTGAAKDIESHVPKTFARLGGTGLTGDDKSALLAYVRALSGPPPKQARDVLAERGKVVFHSAATGCAGCHGALGEQPDGVRHDVKSWAPNDVSARFDTPSLKFVSGSGPWFHDGRYRSLRDLLERSDGKMGRTKHLSPEDLDALEAYLRTL